MDSTDDVMNTISEFIYFRVEPSVKPEDPNSDEGYALLRVFEAAKAQNAYRSSAWGRAIEDKDVIVWVVGAYYPIIYCALRAIAFIPLIRNNFTTTINAEYEIHI